MTSQVAYQFAPPAPPAIGVHVAQHTLTNAFSARLHTSLASAERLWRALQAQGSCTVYQRFEWAACMVAHLVKAQGLELAIVELQDAGVGIMLFPMVLRRQAGLRRIEWLGLGVCDYVGPVMGANAQLLPAQACAAWAAVKSVLPKADVIQITGIPELVFGKINPLALLPHSRPTDMEAFGMAIEGDAETLLQRACKTSFAADMRKKSRMFAKHPDYRFQVASTPAEAEQIFSILLEQRMKRFAELGRFDILNQPEYIAFYRAAALDGITGGPARVFAVQADGEHVATSLGVIHNGAFHGILLAMGDNKWRGYSPGLYMIAESMKWARREGLDFFDMTVGTLPYKDGVGATKQTLLAYVEALTWRGKLAHQVSSLLACAKGKIKANETAYHLARKVTQSLRKLSSLAKRRA